MALIIKSYTFSSGATIVASEHNDNFDTIYTEFNGNIENANIKSTAAIVDTKLAQITTANKVHTSAILTGSANQILVTDAGGTSANWTSRASVSSINTGSAYQFIMTDGGGTSTNWSSVLRANYINTGSANQVLVTDGGGTSSNWSSVIRETAVNTGTANYILVTDKGGSGTNWSNRAYVTSLNTGSANQILVTDGGGTSSNWSSKIIANAVQTGTANYIFVTDGGGTSSNWARSIVVPDALVVSGNCMVYNTDTDHALYVNQNGNLATGKFAFYVNNSGTPADGGKKAIRIDGCATVNNNVACVFTANTGPGGASTNIVGWLELNIDGTPRFIPYW